MRIAAYIVSFIFHPLLILGYMLAFLYTMNPFVFDETSDRERVIFITYTIVSILIIPVVAILLMKNLGIIKSFSMNDRMERVGPMLVVAIVYLWLFINFKNNTILPLVFAAVMLGASISILVAFFINNFTKISLHSIGIGGIVAFMVLLKFKLEYGNIIIAVSKGVYIEIGFYLIILISIVLAGIVGSARLLLKAHSPQQVYAGYIVGFLSQVIGFQVIF